MTDHAPHQPEGIAGFTPPADPSHDPAPPTVSNDNSSVAVPAETAPSSAGGGRSGCLGGTAAMLALVIAVGGYAAHLASGWIG